MRATDFLDAESPAVADSPVSSPAPESSRGRIDSFLDSSEPDEPLPNFSGPSSQDLETQGRLNELSTGLSRLAAVPRATRPEGELNETIETPLDKIWSKFRESDFGRKLLGYTGAREAEVGDTFTQQGVAGTAASIAGRPFVAAGKGTQAVLGDIVMPQKRSEGMQNVRAAIAGDALPIHEEIQNAAKEETDHGEFGVPSLLANISLGIADIAPKLLTMEGGPLVAGSVFGTGADNNFDIKGGAMGAAIPGIANATRALTTSVLDAGINSGAKWLANPALNKAVHIAANQAAMDTVMTAAQTPELMQLAEADPREFKRRLAEIAGSNLAFAVPELFAKSPAKEKPNAQQNTQGNVETARPKGEVAPPSRISAFLGQSPETAPAVEAPPGTAQPQSARGEVADMRPEAVAASTRVNTAVADRQQISGVDARLAGARDRLPDLGYAYNEMRDVYLPVRRVEPAARPIGDAERFEQLKAKAATTTLTPEEQVQFDALDKKSKANSGREAFERVQREADAAKAAAAQSSTQPRPVTAAQPVGELPPVTPPPVAEVKPPTTRAQSREFDSLIQEHGPELGWQGDWDALHAGRPEGGSTMAIEGKKRFSKALQALRRTAASALGIKADEVDTPQGRAKALAFLKQHIEAGGPSDNLTAPEGASTEFLPPEPKPVAEVPKLRAGETTGELLQGSDAPFNLSGEKATDVERIADEKKAKEDAAKANAEFQAKNQLELGAEPSAPVAGTPETVAAEKPAAANVPFADGSKVQIKGGLNETGTKRPFGVQLHTIVRETTDAKFPDERSFEVRNDETGATEERPIGDLRQAKERTAEEKAAAPKKKTKAELDAELKAAGLDPSAFPDAKSKQNALKRAAAKIKELQEKIAGSRSNVQLGVPKAILNIALDAARLLLEGGSTIYEAIDGAIASIRDRMGAEFDADREQFLRESINRALVAPPGESTLTQVQGEKRGIERNAENIEAIQTDVRSRYFDGMQPLSAERTAQARELFDRFSDPMTGKSAAQEVRTSTNAETGPGIVLSELWRYAQKMAAEGNDDTFLRDIVSRYQDFNLLGDTGGGATTAGRALRSLQEAGLMLRQLVEVEGARREAAARELGITPARVGEITTATRSVTPEVTQVETAVNEQETARQRRATASGNRQASLPIETPAQATEFNTRAEQTATDYLNRLQQSQTEWLQPNRNPNQVLEIIKRFLKSDIPVTETTNVLPLRDELVAAGVQPETALTLARDLNRKRIDLWSVRRNRQIQRVLDSGAIRGITEAIRSAPYAKQSDPAWRRQTAIDWLMSNGLARNQAEGVASQYEAAFNEAFANALEKEARRVLGKDAPNRINDIIRAIRVGAADPSKPWFDAFAEKAGWKPGTPEQYKRLVELDDKLTDPSLSPQETAALHEEMMSVLRHMGPRNPPGTYTRRIAEGFVASLLSGIRTITVQAAPVIAAIRDFSIAAISDPKNAASFATSIYRAAKNVLAPELKYAWQKDAYGYHLDAIDRNHKELKKWFETLQEDYKKANPAQKALIRVKQIYALQQYVGRILSTIDQAAMATTRDWKLAYYSSIALKEAGISTGKISDLIDAMAMARQTEFEAAKAQGLDDLTAKVRANSRVQRAVQEFIENKTGDSTLANETLKAAENDIYSMVGRHAEDVKETDEGFITRYTGINAGMEALSKIRGQGGLPGLMAVATLGFVNVPLRTARFMSSFSPYGLFRYGIDRYRNNRGLDSLWKQTYGNSLQARARLREAVAGTVVLGLATALGLKYSTSDDDAGDENKNGIYITGGGPTNKVLRDAWAKNGFKPYSFHFVIDGHKIAIPLTRVGEAIMYPFIIPAALDDANWKRKEIAATGKTPPSQLKQFTQTLVGTAAYMMGQKGLLQGPAQMAQLAQGGAGFEKNIAKFFAATASGVALPFKQALASISNMFVGPMDQSSAESIIANNFPIAGLLYQNKATNRFGDEIYDQSWYGKLYQTGIPIAFQVDKNPTNEKLYPLLVNKGAAPPELRRYILEEKYGPLTDDQFADFAKKSGAMLKQSAVGKIDELQNMSPEDVKKFLSKAASQADKTAAAALGLERATAKPDTATATASPATGGSAGGASTTTTGAVASRRSTGRLRSTLSRGTRLGRTRSRLGRGRASLSSRSRIRSIRAPSRRLRSAMSRPRRPRMSYAV